MKTLVLSLIVLLTLALTSCQDSNSFGTISSGDDSILKSATIAVDDMMAESVAEEVNFEADFFADSEKLLKQLARFKGTKNLLGGKKGMRYMAGQAPNVSIDTAETGYPVIITLDYGEGTELKNGRVISGIVTIEISAEKGTDGAMRSIAYSNCVIDSVGVNGTCIETFNGDNEQTRTVTSNSEITFVLANGTVIDRTGNHVCNWLEGIDTQMEHNDDVIEITGALDAVTPEGNTWTRNIIEPLIRKGDCRHHVQGVVQFSQNDEVISSLDFGDGECDEIALLTVDGETVEIELGGRKPEARFKNRNEN
jgi:hypothetical protein